MLRVLAVALAIVSVEGLKDRHLLAQGRSSDQAGLKTVTLDGFEDKALNTVFTENKEVMISGTPTFWSGDGKNFIYFGQKFGNWRIAGAEQLSNVQKGDLYATFKAKRGANLLNPKLIGGF